MSSGGETVFIMLFALDDFAEGRAGDDAPVAFKRVFVFWIRHERINFAAAHEGDVPGLGASDIPGGTRPRHN
jgi:hypothetical protein